MKNKIKIIKCFLLTLIFLLPGKIAFGQVADINVGNFQLEWHNNAQFVGGGYSSGSFTGVWPNGWYRRGTIGWMGVGETYDRLIKFRNGVDASGGLDTLRQEVEYAPEVDGIVSPLVEKRKEYLPSVIVDGTPAKPYTGKVDRTLPAAQVVETVSKTGWGRGGCWFKIKVYAFDNPKFADFVILDYTMIQKDNFTKENDNANGPTDQIITQWFSPIFNFNPTQYGYEQSGEWWPATDTYSNYVVSASNLVPAGSTVRDSLLVLYSCDSNDPRISGASNFGDPLSSTGELISTQYVGYSLLYADKTPTDKSDDIKQPTNIITASIDELWTWEPEGILFDWATTPGREKVDIGVPWAINPDIAYTQLGRLTYQWVGPYDMAYNDSVHFVFALGAGGIDQARALQFGKEWKAGNYTDEQKDSLIATGLDSLVSTMDKAKWAYNNYLKTGDFGIPWPLPAPDLKVTSGPGWNTIEWDYSDNDMFKDYRTGLDDFKEWRVYQKRGEYQVNHPNDNAFYDYRLIYSTTDRDAKEYRDTAVVRGESYHYYVTAVDKDGNESSKFTNRTLYDASPFKAGSESAYKVKIVPNPYIVNASAMNFSDPNEIKFFNLPPYCTLRIYNEVGDLVKEIEHVSGSGDETWNQLTSANQYVVSGVYILSVQNAKDINGKSIGGKNYKFVIVR